MKLIELNPQWNNDDQGKHHYLVFDCPMQHENHAGTEYAMGCSIVIPVKEASDWHAEGDSFENLTIRPSIWHHCEKDPHFFITNGQIEIC